MSRTCIFTCSTATKFITAESGPFAPPADVTATANSGSSAASTPPILAPRLPSHSATNSPTLRPPCPPPRHSERRLAPPPPRRDRGRAVPLELREQLLHGRVGPLRHLALV